jgi:pyruvate dehydrogenase E1 component beta subunit
VSLDVEAGERTLLYAEALIEGLREALEDDPRTYIVGAYFLGLTRHGALLAKLQAEYPDRIYYPPISENGTVGAGIGMAISGLRPIVDIGTASFAFQAFSQIVNELANIRSMTGGQTGAPLILHMLHGIRGGGAAQHSHSPQAMLWNTPGLQIVLPSTPHDVKGLVKSALHSPDPTIWLDHVKLLDTSGPVPTGQYDVPFGRAVVRREGRDVTVVATSLMVIRALEAAASLASDGIDVEVVDPRTLVPLDTDTILQSVAKTGRLVVVDECHKSCGVAAEISAIVAEQAFDVLRAPILRVTTLDVPVPFSPALERLVEPTVDRIRAAVERIAA